MLIFSRLEIRVHHFNHIINVINIYLICSIAQIDTIAHVIEPETCAMYDRQLQRVAACKGWLTVLPNLGQLIDFLGAFPPDRVWSYV